MPRRLVTLAVVAAAFVAVVPAAASGDDAMGTATMRITGVVQDSIGIAVAADGSFAGSAGTAPATVTREQHGDVVVITVVPQ